MKFIIDSNTTNIITHLYGYMILDNGTITEQYTGVNSGNGCYCLVKNNNGIINIYQDYIGCFGIYLYQRGDYFALSNNLLYLIKYLKNLTLNENYYRKLINAREVSFPQEQTICNEIKRITNDITIVNNHIIINKKEEQQYSINFSDKEYLTILDKWYNKWVNVFRSISNKTVIEDLSGGIDTRILLSMTLNANIKSFLFRSKEYNSNIDGNESKEDFEISNSIINYYKLNRLNKIKIYKDFNLDDNFIFGNSNFSTSIREKPVNKIYRICGNGGLLYHKPNTFKNLLNKRFYSVDDWLIDEFNKYSNEIEVPSYLDKNLYDLYKYKKLIVDLRDGIKSADYYRNGTILICPMMDKDLNKLNILNKEGKSLLPNIILKRYRKDLLNFNFEGLDDKLLSFEEEIEPVSFNFSETKSRDNKVFYYSLPKKEYQSKFKIKNPVDNSHSTGSTIGQTYYVYELIKNKY